MRGNGRIFQRKGSSLWWCAYYLRGKEYRESTGHTDEKKAQKFLQSKLKEVHADQIGARPFVGPQQQRLTVSELLDALEADYKLRNKTSPQFQSHLKHAQQAFGEWRAVDLSAEAVDSYIAERLEQGAAPATVNRSTQLLTQAYRLAMKRKRLSSVPQIRHLSEKGNARQGFFTDSEFRAVKQNLPEYLKDFAHFGYLTGWRRGEVASLEWGDVDGEAIRLRGQNSKNGDGRTVPLEGELARIIERRRAARQVKSSAGVTLASLVFHHDGQPIVDIRKAWATACVAAGVGEMLCDACKQAMTAHRCPECKVETRYRGKLFHDFRRTGVRNMVRAGVPERVAMTISGHKTRSIFDRYNIVSERDLREAMQRTQAYLSTGEQEKRPVRLKAAAAKQGR